MSSGIKDSPDLLWRGNLSKSAQGIIICPEGASTHCILCEPGGSAVIMSYSPGPTMKQSFLIGSIMILDSLQESLPSSAGSMLLGTVGVSNVPFMHAPSAVVMAIGSVQLWVHFSAVLPTPLTLRGLSLWCCVGVSPAFWASVAWARHH